ncbi:MAG: hypothetical protein ABIL47_08875, partial [candidate division WOR-3 bacterium]
MVVKRYYSKMKKLFRKWKDKMIKPSITEANLHREDIDKITGKVTNCGFFIAWKEIRLPIEQFNVKKFNLLVLHKRTKDVLFGKHADNFTSYSYQENGKRESLKNQDDYTLAKEDETLMQEYKIIKESGLFDEEYYLTNNPDVKESG